MTGMATRTSTWEYREITLPRGTPRDAARAALTELAELGDRMWPAAVLVLPGTVTATVTRAAVYAGLRAGRDHVSVVHGLGPDSAGLADLVASTTDRPRRTRLAALLQD